MKNTLIANQIEATLGFAAKFILKLFSFTLLFSIVPLLFVNLPLRMLFINFDSLYTPLMWLANSLSVFFSGALAAKLIFAWGLNGFAFSITRELAKQSH